MHNTYMMLTSCYEMRAAANFVTYTDPTAGNELLDVAANYTRCPDDTYSIELSRAAVVALESYRADRDARVDALDDAFKLRAAKLSQHDAQSLEDFIKAEWSKVDVMGRAARPTEAHLTGGFFNGSFCDLETHTTLSGLFQRLNLGKTTHVLNQDPL